VEVDEPDHVIVWDKYPKARFHFLLIPKDPRYRNATPTDLTRDDVPLLKKLHKCAADFGEHTAVVSVCTALLCYCLYEYDTHTHLSLPPLSSSCLLSLLTHFHSPFVSLRAASTKEGSGGRWRG
jgi:hypothetical protein